MKNYYVVSVGSGINEGYVTLSTIKPFVTEEQYLNKTEIVITLSEIDEGTGHTSDSVLTLPVSVINSLIATEKVLYFVNNEWIELDTDTVFKKKHYKFYYHRSQFSEIFRFCKPERFLGHLKGISLAYTIDGVIKKQREDIDKITDFELATIEIWA